MSNLCYRCVGYILFIILNQLNSSQVCYILYYLDSIIRSNIHGPLAPILKEFHCKIASSIRKLISSQLPFVLMIAITELQAVRVTHYKKNQYCRKFACLIFTKQHLVNNTSKKVVNHKLFEFVQKQGKLMNNPDQRSQHLVKQTSSACCTLLKIY